MTAQINDFFRHNENEYVLAGISEGSLFEPSILNLIPYRVPHYCNRGYYATFALSNLQIILDDLHINHVEEDENFQRLDPPVINGVSPTPPKGIYDGFYHYEGLRYYLKYSGGLLLADRFIDELYVHGGFQPAWKYEKVIEFIFEDGILLNQIDRSEMIAQIRTQFIKLGNDEELDEILQIGGFSELSWDRSYEI